VYTEREIDEYSEYMDWVREQIADDEDRKDPRFSEKLIDIDEISMEGGPTGRFWRHHWSMTYSDGDVVVGELKTAAFDDWLAVKIAKHRSARLEELGI